MTSYASENTCFSFHPMMYKCSNIDIMSTIDIDEIVHAFLVSQICIYGEVNIKESINRFFKHNVHFMNYFHIIVCGG